VASERSTIERLMPLAISGVVIVADRISKTSIQHSINLFDSVSVVPGWVRIVHTENAGAAFGLLADGNALLRTAVLVGISSLVLLFVASSLWGRGTGFTSPGSRIALSLILGGATGNLYDRIFHRTVTDFLEVYRGTWSFPAFNVADSAITIGAILLLIDLVRPRGKGVEEHARLAHK